MGATVTVLLHSLHFETDAATRKGSQVQQTGSSSLQVLGQRLVFVEQLEGHAGDQHHKVAEAREQFAEVVGRVSVRGGEYLEADAPKEMRWRCSGQGCIISLSR